MLQHWQSWHGVGNQQQQIRTSRIEIMSKMVIRKMVQAIVMILPLFMIMNRTGEGKRSTYADATEAIGRYGQQKSMFSLINIS